VGSGDGPAGGDAPSTDGQPLVDRAAAEAGPDAADGPVDAAADPALDGPGMDAGSDGGIDGAADAPLDAPLDAPVDLAADVAPDGLADAGDAASPPDATDLPAACTAAPPSQVVFVDGNLGSDVTGNGSQACPLRSITRALTLAAANTGLDTVQIAGDTASAPLVYSADTTGEVFPLRPPAGISLLGDGQTLVSIEGSGDCLPEDFPRPCAIEINSAGVSISGVNVTSPTGDGVAVGNLGSDFTIDATSLTGCHSAGLSLINAGTVTVTGVTASGNSTGFFTQGDSNMLTLDGVTATGNSLGLGLFPEFEFGSEQGAGHVISRNSTFSQNGFGASLQIADWTSTGDTFDGNRGTGISIDQSRVVISGAAGAPCSVSGNGTMTPSHGIEFTNRSATLMMSGCVVLANSDCGVMAPDMVTIDLGSTTGSPGGNTFGSSTASLKNATAGICYGNNFRPLQAQNDHWSQCPPSQSDTCAGGLDICVPGGVALQLDGCQTP
jgi:hypothetical protein